MAVYLTVAGSLTRSSLLYTEPDFFSGHPALAFGTRMVMFPRSYIDAVAFGTKNHTTFFRFITPFLIFAPLEPERLYFHHGIDKLQTVGANHRHKGHHVVPINPSGYLGFIAAVWAIKIIEYPHWGKITKRSGKIINKNPDFAVRD
jgi:hypothetical protein